jgi:hypothetical protein
MKHEQAAKQDEVVVEFDAGAFIKKHGTKSAAIRALNAEGKSRSEIAELLKIRYQHVRNVLITPIKKQK